jgi:uncharacterized membrane protein YbhN (UPF0104 family)
VSDGSKVARRGARLRGVAKALVAAGVVASVVWALRGYREPLAGRLEQLRGGWILAGVALCVLYRVVNAYGWVLVLRALGQRVPGRRGVRLWLVSETLRWLPGSVWSFFSRVGQAREIGVPPAIASLSLPLELLLTIGAWLVAALAGVGFSGVAREWFARLPGFWVVVTALALALMVLAVLALARWWPAARVSAKLRGLQTAVGELRKARPSVAVLAWTFVFYVALCLLNGVAFHVVLRAAGVQPPPILAAIGVNAVGWLVGFFAFFAPAGLGVREGGMAAMLAPSMALDAAIVGVLIWRLTQIFVEFVCLVPCLLPGALAALRRRSRSAPAAG